MLKGAINLGNPVSNSPLNRGLQAWLLALPGRMSGATFCELTPNRRHAAFTNAPSWASSTGRPGGIGTIVETAASTMGVSVPNPVALNSSVSAAMWLRPTTSVGGLCSCWAMGGASSTAGGTAFGLLRNPVFADSKLALTWGLFGSVITTTNTFSASTWFHVLCTRTGTTGNIYVNGLLDTTGTNADSPGNGSGTLTWAVGNGVTFAKSGADWWDDFRIWDRCLSADEALRVYNDSRTGYQQTLNRLPMRVYGTAAAAASGNRRRRVIC